MAVGRPEPQRSRRHVGEDATAPATTESNIHVREHADEIVELANGIGSADRFRQRFSA